MSDTAQRLRDLLSEAIPYVERARISHLGIDPVIIAHNDARNLSTRCGPHLTAMISR